MIVFAFVLLGVAVACFLAGWVACSIYQDSFERRAGTLDLTGMRRPTDVPPPPPNLGIPERSPRRRWHDISKPDTRGGG